MSNVAMRLAETSLIVSHADCVGGALTLIPCGTCRHNVEKVNFAGHFTLVSPRCESEASSEAEADDPDAATGESRGRCRASHGSAERRGEAEPAEPAELEPRSEPSEQSATL